MADRTRADLDTIRDCSDSLFRIHREFKEHGSPAAAEFRFRDDLGENPAKHTKTAADTYDDVDRKPAQTPPRRPHEGREATRPRDCEPLHVGAPLPGAPYEVTRLGKKPRGMTGTIRTLGTKVVDGGESKEYADEPGGRCGGCDGVTRASAHAEIPAVIGKVPISFPPSQPTCFPWGVPGETPLRARHPRTVHGRVKRPQGHVPDADLALSLYCGGGASANPRFYDTRIEVDDATLHAIPEVPLFSAQSVLAGPRSSPVA
ncbi:hypothetical protein [Streptomyces sp. NPDC004629]|uniref:hypothetical protein n=1 Tax=Streptomyces sp. NPDC004629 TaxID=3364705 RepID=UPI0036877802